MSAKISKCIASTKILEHQGSIWPFSFYRQPPNYWSHTFSLACSVDEFSFKEMRTWGQSKFTSYCICVWCESGEFGARWGSRFPCCNSSRGNLRQSCQTSTMELLHVNSQQPKHVDCSPQKLQNRHPIGF